jgi:UDP-N-acetylmuramate dehydrogenase
MNALALPPEINARVLRDEPLAKHTSWRVGGPADLFFRPLDVEDLAQFLRQLDPGTPVLWIGLGSNLLVRDGGVRGAVIATYGAFGKIHRRGELQVEVEAGVHCSRLARHCVQWGIGPGEFFAGIPGTLGGALAMNAGAFGGETWAHVLEVETIDRGGVVHRRPRSDFDISYRRVAGPANEWFLGAAFLFERRPQNAADGRQQVKELLTRRKETQPLGELSCGSVFTNPPGDHAARLIEAAGLKGFRIGGARVSEKHANFIINDGRATAVELEALIAHVRATVERVHGVALQAEVRIVGEALAAADR